MPTFPIPIFVAGFLFFLCFHAFRHKKLPSILLVVLLACAIQSLFIAFRVHYQIAEIVPFQVFGAACLPPLSYLAFQHCAVRPLLLSKDWLHGLGPAFILFCFFFATSSLDYTIPLLFMGYGAVILIKIFGGESALPQVNLSSGKLPVIIWRIMGIILIISAFSDMIISLDYAFNDGTNAGWLLSLFSSLLPMTIALISLQKDLGLTPVELEAPQEDDPQATIPAEENYEDVMNHIRSFFAQEKPYLDPDLTLAKLGKRLTLPAKKISAAINSETGENASRFVNRYRIDHACGLIAKGMPITTAYLDSGFNSKSNFNREFSQIKGATPTEWRQNQKSAVQT